MNTGADCVCADISRFHSQIIAEILIDFTQLHLTKAYRRLLPSAIDVVCANRRYPYIAISKGSIHTSYKPNILNPVSEGAIIIRY